MLNAAYEQKSLEGTRVHIKFRNVGFIAKNNP